jgi:hypothetical protein
MIFRMQRRVSDPLSPGSTSWASPGIPNGTSEHHPPTTCQCPEFCSRRRRMCRGGGDLSTSFGSNGCSHDAGRNAGLILRAPALVAYSCMQFHLSWFMRIRIANGPMNFISFRAQPVGVMRSLVDNQTCSRAIEEEQVSPNAIGKHCDPESEWLSDETITKEKSLRMRVH